MENETKIPAPIPSNQGDLSVHLSYIRRDIDEMKKTHESGLNNIRHDLQELKGVYVGRTEFIELQGDLKSLRDTEFKILKESMVTKEVFEPAKKLIYGGAGLTLIAVVGAVIASVLK